MSNKINDGGTAFPCEGGAMSALIADPGMSLRDYFAGQALAGMMQEGFMPSFASAVLTGGGEQWHYAKAAYLVADAMLAARGGDK